MYNAYTLQLAQLDREGRKPSPPQLTALGSGVSGPATPQDSKDNFSDVISSLNYGAGADLLLWGAGFCGSVQPDQHQHH